METVTDLTWVQAFRRAPVTDLRVAGPWHVVAGGGLGLTWCGRKMRVVSRRYRTEPATIPISPPDGKMCDECRTALAADRPRAYRRR